jgi:hypothetical protein
MLHRRLTRPLSAHLTLPHLATQRISLRWTILGATFRAPIALRCALVYQQERHRHSRFARVQCLLASTLSALRHDLVALLPGLLRFRDFSCTLAPYTPTLFTTAAPSSDCC